ncbi:MAG: metallophosphoesterase [Anaerolineae bacterium]|nr:metallophosphoesterase [Anaerolineae bacterium]
MKILVVSDKVEEQIYSSQIKQNFAGIEAVIGCGDLPYYYLEFIVDTLSVPVYYVRGNHAKKVEFGETVNRTSPGGAVDLHRKMERCGNLLLLGFEGSLRYRPGPFQYTQLEMWLMALGQVPRLVWNRIRFGRFLDILVTHAPPWLIHDRRDLPHQGFKAIRWMVEVFQPRFHFHGHIHSYDSSEKFITRHKGTQIVNAFGHKVVDVDLQGED